MKTLANLEGLDLVVLFPAEVSECLRGFPVNQRLESLVSQFMAIRHKIWVVDHGWEEDDKDHYDLCSTFLLLVKNGVVLAGCRLIHDVYGLPIRELVGETAVPSGSIELSRFCVTKNSTLPRSRLARLLVYGITIYTCRLEIAGKVCAVLRDSLILLLKNFQVQIEPVAGRTTRHRLSSFSPVLLDRWQTADNLNLPVVAHTAG